MITLGGTFQEVAAWLQGFAAGLSEADPDSASEWYNFVEWLPQKLHYPINHVWCHVLSQAYPKNSDALEQLHLLYTEYKSADAASKG